MYNINWNRFVDWLIWSAIRKPVEQAWLHALLNPVKIIHNRLLNFRSEKITEIQTTGQVSILRNGLNKRFDPAQYRIVIEDGEETAFIFIYTEIENKPFYLTDFITGNDGDFIVYVPIDLINSESSIRAFINKYKLASKRWKMIWV